MEPPTDSDCGWDWVPASAGTTVLFFLPCPLSLDPCRTHHSLPRLVVAQARPKGHEFPAPPSPTRGEGLDGLGPLSRHSMHAVRFCRRDACTANSSHHPALGRRWFVGVVALLLTSKQSPSKASAIYCVMPSSALFLLPAFNLLPSLSTQRKACRIRSSNSWRLHFSYRCANAPAPVQSIHSTCHAHQLRIHAQRRRVSSHP